MTLPGGSALWAQVHHNLMLCLGDLHVTLGGPAIEGSEGRGVVKVAFGSKRCFHDLQPPHAFSGRTALRQSVAECHVSHPETNHPAANTFGLAEASNTSMMFTDG